MTRPPTAVLIRELEKAIERAVEAPSLADMTDHELRAVIYDIVEVYQRELADPALYLERLVDLGLERRDDVTDARARSVAARESILRRILELITPVLPSMLGRVPAETWNLPGQHEQRTDHPLLCGFEIVDGRRRAPAGNGRVRISGRSWWIVALPPDDALVTPRIACLEYSGEMDERRGGQGEGHVLVTPTLLTVAEAAEEIRDDVFDKLLSAVIHRLRSISSDKQRELAAEFDQRVEMLHAGYAAMQKVRPKDKAS